MKKTSQRHALFVSGHQKDVDDAKDGGKHG